MGGGTVWGSKAHELIEGGMNKIREITDCPVCILAALRQREIPIMMVSSFNYKNETKEYLNEKYMDFNECY